MVQWNEEEIKEFRDASIRNPKDLIKGETYYSNSFPDTFVMGDVCTYAESRKRRGEKPSSLTGMGKWAELISAEYMGRRVVTERWMSLNDRSVRENPYNPWMIFRTKEMAERARKEIKLTYPKHDDWSMCV